MFKKKPQIKNLSPLRSSDRRKIADQIIADFEVSVPPPPPSAEATTQPNTENGAPENGPSVTPTLTSVRAALLPENCQSARFTTHSGPDAKLVSGTVYVGSHPGQEERILWIQMGQNTPRLYPTVYTLWHNPGLVPLLHTPAFVVEKLQTGADLMTPGLAGGPPFPNRATRNAIVAVASTDAPTVPKFLGICEIDVSQLQHVQGAKGHAVNGVHWEGDEIWAWSQTGTGGRPGPADIEGWGIKDAENGVKSLALEENEDDEDGEEGGASLEEVGKPNGKLAEELGEVVQQREPTTQEIDRAFHNAFLYAIYNAKQKGNPPHYGIEFPIQPSFLISQMIQPYLPIFNPNHAQFYNIKKSSWKTTKKFIKHLDKEVLIKSKDRDKNETIILDVDFDDQQVSNFTPYKLPKAKTNAEGGKATSTQNDADPSLGQSIALQQLYRPSPKLVPDLFPSKTDYYTQSHVSSWCHTYIQNHPDLAKDSSSPRFIKLNPFLANNVFDGSQGAADAKVLAAGEVTRDALHRRLIDNSSLCSPYWVLLRDNQKWEVGAPNLPKPKSGTTPKATVIIEKRTGTKTVSKVGNVELFGLSPELLAAELQKKCASSTSVGQLVGGKPGMLEVLVQGDQRATIEKELGKRGVQSKWIELLDKTKKKGGGGGGGGGGGRR
ncbi:MAG: hypothetical protein Q9227_004599 [Pyrenula ochraceoflavens]